MAQVNVSVWGRQYDNTLDMQRRMIDLRNANHNIGPSDDRVSELDALQEALDAAMVPVREERLREALAELGEEPEGATGVWFTCRTSHVNHYGNKVHSLKTFRYGSRAAAERAIPKLAANRRVWSFMGYSWSK